MRFLALFVFVAAAVAPAAAQSPSGMAAMQYYAGTWACAAEGEPDSNATEVFTVENGTLRESVVIPPQGKMTEPYQLTIVTVYDAKNGRYVKTRSDNLAMWSVSYAKPFTGTTEEWTDTATYNGQLGRSEIVRTDQNTFDTFGYLTASQTKPDFKVTCHRS